MHFPPKKCIISNREYCYRGKYTRETMVRHVRLRRDVRRGTFVSFVAPTRAVSVGARAVTVTARNARRFVRHGVSTTSWVPHSDDRVSISITSASGHPAAALRLPTTLSSFSPRVRRAVHFCTTHVSPPIYTLF